jgi:hypothetical protein
MTKENLLCCLMTLRNDRVLIENKNDFLK